MSRVKQLFQPFVTFLVTVLTFGLLFVLFSVFLMGVTSARGHFFTFALALLSGMITGFAVPIFRRISRPRFWIPLNCLILFLIIGAVTIGLALWHDPHNSGFRLTYCFLLGAGAVAGSFFGVTLLSYFKKPGEAPSRS
ncbi:MAG: hypothetical protein KDA65_01160 [Planctomycetaceae bacterium]|nr:hypothetical protein [Planctomycetaceae bacterium]